MDEGHERGEAPRGGHAADGLGCCFENYLA